MTIIVGARGKFLFGDLVTFSYLYREVKALPLSHVVFSICSGPKMAKWRERFHINYITQSHGNCGGKRMSPRGLMDHVESKMESCLLHHGLYHYLWTLYGNLRGVGHKALYKTGSQFYNRALAEENKEKEE